MKLIVLGSGTCVGTPLGVTPRAPPLFALDVAPAGAPPRWVLFDCSEGARHRLHAAGIAPTEVRHVALSHPHPDHAALPQFIQGRVCDGLFHGLGLRDPSTLDLTLYLPAAAAADLPALWRWHQPEDEGRASSHYTFAVVPTPDGFAHELEPGVLLRAFAVHHGFGRSPAVAFRVEAHGAVFAYSGDTGLCDGIHAAARDATLFLCEASTRVGRDSALGYGHLNPRQAGEVARTSGAKRLVLTHYTGLDPDNALLADARASGYAGAIELAYDGQRLEI